MKQVQRGFTLIEMMLVLVILAIMAVTGLSAYQQRIQTVKVEQTALQMQQILQAAQAIYVDNCQASGGCQWQLDPTQQYTNYLVGTPFNTCPWYPFSTSYCYSIQTQSSKADLFSIKLVLPATLPNALAVAQMIVAHLPNAEVNTDDGVAVIASIPKFPKLPDTERSPVRGVYSMRSGDNDPTHAITFKNDCANTSTPYQVVYLSLSAYTSNFYENGGATTTAANYYYMFYSNITGKSYSCLVNPGATLNPSYATISGIWGNMQHFTSSKAPVQLIETCQATPPPGDVCLTLGQTNAKINANVNNNQQLTKYF